VIHDGMPYDPIQGHGGLKYVKMADFKRYLLHQDTARQYLNFNWTDF